MKHWEITDTGLIRHENQDAFGFAQLPGGYAVAVVCDGMGGVAGGSIASTVAVETFIRTLTETVHSGHTDRAVQEAVTAGQRRHTPAGRRSSGAEKHGHHPGVRPGEGR